MISVFKIGGAVIEDTAMMDRFCKDFASVDGPKVLVHGGGVMASELQKALGETPVKIEGRRVTDEAALKAVTFTYAGWCNKMIVAILQKYACNAIGLSGCDGNVITAKKRAPRTLSDGVTVVDYGFVGDVTKDSVNVGMLEKLIDSGLTPVLCAINHDGQGQLLNTNADTIAASVASALKARLVCCFELDGVLARKDDPESLFREVSEASFKSLVQEGIVEGGMIPKIENCIKALREGASEAVIKNAARISEDVQTKISL